MKQHTLVMLIVAAIVAAIVAVDAEMPPNGQDVVKYCHKQHGRRQSSASLRYRG